MSYLKAIDFDDIGVALPLLRRGLGGLDRRRRHGRFVHGEPEVDDLQVYVKHVQLVEAECAREAVLCFGTRLRRSCSLARSRHHHRHHRLHR